MACPAPDPTTKKLFSGAQVSTGPAFIISVDENVVRKTAIKPPSGSANHFKDLSKVGADIIRAGDTLGLTIWENVQDQLLGDMGPATLQTVQVDGEGYISLSPMRDVFKPPATHQNQFEKSSPTSSKNRPLTHRLRSGGSQAMAQLSRCWDLLGRR